VSGPPYQVIYRRAISEYQLMEVTLRMRELGLPLTPITQALHLLDTTLSHDPQEKGESRAYGERMIIVDPLTATFEVHEDERIVFVLRLFIDFRYLSRP
jgi:hypothetical protein